MKHRFSKKPYKRKWASFWGWVDELSLRHAVHRRFESRLYLLLFISINYYLVICEYTSSLCSSLSRKVNRKRQTILTTFFVLNLRLLEILYKKVTNINLGYLLLFVNTRLKFRKIGLSCILDVVVAHTKLWKIQLLDRR